MKLADFDVLTFDCYGTLIDWERGLLDALAPWLGRHGRVLPPSRILETYAGIEAELEAEHPGWPYPEILSEVLRRLGQAWDLDVSDGEARAFGASVAAWPAFPDSPDALRYLEQHFRLVILSNIDRASFRASEEKLGVRFHEVLTAEDIGSYKPDPRNFEALLQALVSESIDPSRILHTAQSLFHDHVPAQAAGLATAWIDRRHDQEGWGATPAAEGVKPHFHFPSMEAMVHAHRKGG